MLIKVDNLTFSYEGSAHKVFDRVSFCLDTTWKVGLIGRNGIGKSTFFKLLQGLPEYQYSGTIDSRLEVVKFPPTISDEHKSALELFREISPAEEWEFYRELSLLGLDEELIERPFRTLSKGQQTKILLAALFTIEHKYLLIDEPTNHLDLEGRQLVADYLKQKNGFLLISHDRHFLDDIIDHVISINRATIDVQKGNYSSWQHNKQLRDQYELETNEALKKDISRLKAAAARTSAWSDKVEKTKKATQSSGLRPDTGYIGHKAAKMMQRSKNLERRQLKAITEKQQLLQDLEEIEKLAMAPIEHHRSLLLAVKQLTAGFTAISNHQRQVALQVEPSPPLFQPVSFLVERGDRIAITGPNGCGKSSLLHLLIQHIEATNAGLSLTQWQQQHQSTPELTSPNAKARNQDEDTLSGGATNSDSAQAIPSILTQLSGSIETAKLEISYIAQDATRLSGSLDDYLASEYADNTKVKTLLRKLGFARESFEVPMELYSDGQKKKVLIALALAKPAHLYIWDEPLNYIDVISRQQLEEVILEVQPTLIFIEHDRRFVETIASKTVQLMPHQAN